MSGLQRTWMGIEPGDQADVEIIPENHIRDMYLSSLDIEIGFHKPSQQSSEQFSADDISRHFVRAYGGQIWGLHQAASFEYHEHALKAVVKGMQVLDLSEKKANSLGVGMGILVEETDITILKAADSHIKLKASARK
jgi:vesicle-fusing ATPase